MKTACFNDWSVAFDCCRDHDCPLIVVMVAPANDPGRYKIFPSGHKERLLRDAEPQQPLVDELAAALARCIHALLIVGPQYIGDADRAAIARYTAERVARYDAERESTGECNCRHAMRRSPACPVHGEIG